MTTSEDRHREYYRRQGEHRDELWPYLELLGWVLVYAVVIGWALEESGALAWLAAWSRSV